MESLLDYIEKSREEAERVGSSVKDFKVFRGQVYTLDCAEKPPTQCIPMTDAAAIKLLATSVVFNCMACRFARFAER